MVFVTGDCHGDPSKIVDFCDIHQTTKDDVLVILGDHGFNYYGEKESRRIKRLLESVPITLVMVRGNHDRRPTSEFYTVIEKDLPQIKGSFYAEYDYPSLLHTIDGHYYDLGGKRCFVMGGAYSIDQERRKQMTKIGLHGYFWFPDEQMTPEEFEFCEQEFAKRNPDEPLIILAHTCPQQKIPHDCFLSGVDQRGVDRYMETKFDGFYNQLGENDRWLCGHYHTDRLVDNVRFYFNDITEL